MTKTPIACLHQPKPSRPLVGLASLTGLTKGNIEDQHIPSNYKVRPGPSGRNMPKHAQAIHHNLKPIQQIQAINIL